MTDRPLYIKEDAQEIVRLMHDHGRKPTEIAEYLNSNGHRTRKDTDITREHVRSVVRRLSTPENTGELLPWERGINPPTPVPTPPPGVDGGSLTRSPATIVVEPVADSSPLPDTKAMFGDGPATPQGERAWAYRLLRSLIGPEVELTIVRQENGTFQVVRCKSCGLTDTKRLNHFSRTLMRLDRMIVSAEKGAAGPDPGNEGGPTGRGVDDLLPHEEAEILDQFLRSLGKTYQDYLQYIEQVRT